MLGNKKVIGVCLTKMNGVSCSDYLHRLHYIANRANCKLFIFNTVTDFFNNDATNRTARSIYELINFDVIDALVIKCDTFHDRTVYEPVIANAKMNNVPVVLVGDEKEGCHSVLTDYDDTYKALLCHVMREHGIKDTFMIAGNSFNDPESVRRIRCYKEALEECGLTFSEDMVAYGEYWSGPPKEIVHKLQDEGRMPKAFFCTNDYMAFSVCEELMKMGYKVPDEIVVTGFDGVPAAEHFSPQITTCCENLESLAMLTLEAAFNAIQDNSVTRVFKCPYSAQISESCGCRRHSDDDYREAAAKLFQSIDEIERHEEFVYECIDKMLEIRDINSLYSTISSVLLQNSYMCFNSNLVSSVMDYSGAMIGGPFSEQLTVISSEHTYHETEKITQIQRVDMVPYLDGWLEDDTSCIFTAINVGDIVCGYYAVKTDDMLYTKYRINRAIKAINIALNVAMNHFKEEKLRLRVENAKLYNNVSGLPSMRGALKWFKDFGNNPANQGYVISVSIYALPKYAYIYENFGIEAAEEAVRFVAEALKTANPNNCFVAQIGDGEFTVINYYKDYSEVSDVINKATTTFFGIIEGYNSTNGKPYFTEVNCGCTVVEGKWTGSLESYIKFANAEMYMNRLNSAHTPAIKEQTSNTEFYKVFDLLVSKNMFSYHFQPIVSAKSGDIYAFEALMRTDPKIGMNPLQVLDTAREYHRLYDIEKATMFNVMDRYANESYKFGDALVFINTIPGHFLDEDDIEILSQKHRRYMDKFVFELTEQGTVSDEELASIKRLSGTSDASHIAIDDYGTGHSNIVNLMRYAPRVIKVDRYLISSIEKDLNKQMFVRSTIDFARMNNIKVLAEGVETYNELRTVIDLGVDFIQGYYIARPAAEPIAAIPDEVREEIRNANPLYDTNND